MARKHDRRQMVVNLTADILRQKSRNPRFILRNYTNPKPWYIPSFLYKKMLELIIRFPKESDIIEIDP